LICKRRDDSSSSQLLSNASGGVKLQVLSSDVETAKKGLSESNSLVADYSESNIKCTNCNF
jgi:hypothetical protein